MAKAKHLEILRSGVEHWNAWRQENADVTPDLSEANLIRANLGYAKLNGGHLSGANLVRANLRLAKLTDANLFGVHLTDANLVGAKLAGAILTGAILTGANLTDANLTDANLIGANLRLANLSLARLVGANLMSANLNFANLDGAKLAGAHLRYADLGYAKLQAANLTGAQFAEAICWSTLFCNVDLSTATGLDKVIQRGPSTIGLDTIYRSKGKIPEVFLRGCGIPENFITYMHSLTGAAFEFYSCFISYSTRDQEFADRLHADLQAHGVRCWFAPHDIQGGKKIHEQIDEAIRIYDKLLLILSAASMNSNWVKTEIANARAREEQQKRQMLFPITLVPYQQIKGWKLFDGDTGIDSAREIREYFVPDFSNWKDHDSYQKAFERLLRDLQAEAREATA